MPAREIPDVVVPEPARVAVAEENLSVTDEHGCHHRLHSTARSHSEARPGLVGAARDDVAVGVWGRLSGNRIDDPSEIPTTAEAVAASVAVAAQLGLPTGNPVVVADGYSVRVRLDPSPVLTRVVTAGRLLRGQPRPWMEREIAVSRYLCAAGAPVVPPWPEAGPHEAHGLEVSLWQWLDPVPQTVPAEVYGPLLKDLHDALDGYDAELPVLVGPLTDIAAAVRASDNPVLREAAARLVPLALTWPRRPLHGDAHTGNVLSTAAGPRWMDFEDVCVGPVEWDLASRTLTETVVDAYPGEVDRVRLEDCRDLRHLQILAGLLTDDVQDAALCDEITARLAQRQG